MRKRGVYLILVFLVVGGVLVAVFARREREPEYRGKRLSEWVAMMGFTPGSVEYFKAKEAVGRIGTNAVPFLLDWIQYEPPAWKAKLYNTVNSLLEKLQCEWLLSDEQALLAWGASAAFADLGPEANGAIPELARILDGPGTSLPKGRAIDVLASLRQRGILTAALTNQTHRTPDETVRIATYLFQMKIDADAILRQLLTNADWSVRSHATNALQEINTPELESASR